MNILRKWRERREARDRRGRALYLMYATFGLDQLLHGGRSTLVMSREGEQYMADAGMKLHRTDGDGRVQATYNYRTGEWEPA